MADVLTAHFATPDARPQELAFAFHELYVPIHPNGHIDFAAMNADRDRVLETGRWLVRNGTDQCAVTIGLAILGAVGIETRDIPLVQTIGLLSNHFGSLAARALRRVEGGAQALLWLAERVTGWGRVYVVEALCRARDPATFPWMRRHAVDGDGLNGYFAGNVASSSRLHEAIDQFSTDPEFVDATSRLLYVMSVSEGMGMPLRSYRHAGAVLSAHSRALARLDPTATRIKAAAVIAEYLGRKNPADAATSAAWNEARTRYIQTLGREEWVEQARSAGG